MRLPVTRYYGSKRKLVDKIWEALQEQQVQFNSVLDVFGGTGIVSYYMLKKGKQVFYNDILSFNCVNAEALMQSPKGVLTVEEAMSLIWPLDEVDYQHIISENFGDVYFLDRENEQIDIIVQNIQRLAPEKQASAYYILFQSCMIKRPFNIFHRKNLNLRTNYQDSKFGNKVTWEQPFEQLFVKFAKELQEFQFEELPDFEISNQSALNCNIQADLVYIDTPYFTKRNGNSITYHNRYHFLEGLLHYEEIPVLIDNNKVNKEIVLGKNMEFECSRQYLQDLSSLLEKHRGSTIALSYTTSGYPSIDELEELVRRYKPLTHVCYLGKHSFALNRNNRERQEVLIIGKDN